MLCFYILFVQSWGCSHDWTLCVPVTESSFKTNQCVVPKMSRLKLFSATESLGIWGYFRDICWWCFRLKITTVFNYQWIYYSAPFKSKGFGWLRLSLIITVLNDCKWLVTFSNSNHICWEIRYNEHLLCKSLKPKKYNWLIYVMFGFDQQIELFRIWIFLGLRLEVFSLA